MQTTQLTVTRIVLTAVTLLLGTCTTARAEDAAAKAADQQPKADAPAPPAPPAQATPAKDAAPAEAKSEGKSNKPAFAVLLKDATKVNGLIPLWRKDDKVYAELTDSLLGKEFFVLISIARGIGDRFLLGGMSLGFGDDWVWQFRKVDDNIQVIRKNVRFFADKGSPEEKAVDLAYTDSVLFSLPIATTGPAGGHVIDQGAARLFLREGPLHVGAGQGLSRQRRTRGGRHLWLERFAGHRHGARFTRRDDHGALLAQPAAAEQLPAAAGRQPRRLLRDGAQGLLAAGRRGPVRPLHQPLEPREGRCLVAGFAAEEADRVLDREDGALQVSAGHPGGHRVMERGL
jgi:hypothetical protein